MIYTLCLSPAIDYNIYIDKVNLDKINKSKVETFHAGGKAINVSIVLKELGVDSVCLGFLGGFTGEYIKNYLDRQGIKNDFVWIDNDTRINVKIKSNSGETAIDGMGPSVNEIYVQELISKISKLGKGDILVLSGNKCAGLNDDIYERILKKVNNDVIVIVDSVRKLLTSTLKYKPLFIKPNEEELEEITKIHLSNDYKVLEACNKLLEKGAQNVLLTMGCDGAYLVNNEGYLYIPTTNDFENVINTIGCGDSVVAGTIAQYLKTKDIKEASIYGCACGIACAHSEHFGKKEEIGKVFEEIKNKVKY